VGASGLNLSGQGQGQVVASCEHGNKTSSCMKSGKFRD
jgi:hypothetical protein